MNLLKTIGVDIAEAGMDQTAFGFFEMKMRAWYNPMRWIKGKFYYKNISHYFQKK